MCKDCKFGNPCLDCPDYDRTKDDCKSNGACALTGEEKMDKEYRNAHKKMVKSTLAEKSGKQNIKKCKKIIALAKELNAMGYGNVKFTADNIGDIENNDKEGGQSERG